MSQSTRVRTLGAVLYEDFEVLDLYGPLEMFGFLAPEVRIVTVAETPGPVASLPGVKTLAEHGFAGCPPLDLVLVPGGLGSARQVDNPALLAFLRAQARTAEITMSVCTGSAILARAGCSTGPGHVEQAAVQARDRPERPGPLGARGAVGRGRTLRHLVGHLCGHRHGPGGDRAALWPGAGGADRHACGVHLARRRRPGSVLSAPQPGRPPADPGRPGPRLRVATQAESVRPVPGKMPVETDEGEGRPSRWNTLRAQRRR